MIDSYHYHAIAYKILFSNKIGQKSCNKYMDKNLLIPKQSNPKEGHLILLIHLIDPYRVTILIARWWWKIPKTELEMIKWIF